jgi:hypothetical protein
VIAGERGKDVEQPEFMNDKETAEEREAKKEGKEPDSASQRQEKRERIVDISIQNTFRH